MKNLISGDTLYMLSDGMLKDDLGIANTEHRTIIMSTINRHFPKSKLAVGLRYCRSVGSSYENKYGETIDS